MARKANVEEETRTLTTEELWVRFKDTGEPAIKAELVERHATLVRYVAERICSNLPRSVDVDDLVQEGNFGLMDAIEKFDLDRGIKFKTYCSTRIRGAILDALRSQDWVPRLVRQRAAKLDRVRQDWLARYGCEPTNSELARALEVEERDLHGAMKKAAPRAMLNLSDRRTKDSSETEPQMDSLGESSEPSPLDRAHRTDLLEVLTRNLTPKEKGILHMYYLEGLTLREIGQRLALTESRVCQIHSNILKRLRDRLDPNFEH